MQNFVESFVVPLLAKRRWNRVCEIGASLGGSTELLAMLPTIAVTVIDPCLECDLRSTDRGCARSASFAEGVRCASRS